MLRRERGIAIGSAARFTFLAREESPPPAAEKVPSVVEKLDIRRGHQAAPSRRRCSLP